MRPTLVIVIARQLLAAGGLVPAALCAQAVTVGGGLGTLGVSASGYVSQVAVSYDAPLHGRTRWWAGVQAGRDPNPGVASPSTRQSVAELVVSVGPMLPVRLTRRAMAFIGAGGYGVVRRYGVARLASGGPALTEAFFTGGDWGALGRAGLGLEVWPRWSAMIDGQLRVAVEGSERSQQPTFSVGLRRQW
jgi:hypothetical protein